MTTANRQPLEWVKDNARSYHTEPRAWRIDHLACGEYQLFSFYSQLYTRHEDLLDAMLEAERRI